ncbi:MAG: tRNA preQ1(34) S-adenosylmethionine ribosyltransferase-isomerase QueA [Chloroflexi bacterium]|nr:tRNA preQ1(34) S-adenosylmethionine ribosyltransferase-isomerase QueA [Chloroflexota bacterium]
MRTSDFDYDLPPELIAQQPVEPRDSARLLVVSRGTGALAHHHVRDLPALLRAGDLLVLNDTRVMAARLLGVRGDTGGRVEILLLREHDDGAWFALVRPGRAATPGREFQLEAHDGPLTATVRRREEDVATVTFDRPIDPASAGTVPLPPYIRDYEGDPERYQTIYAREPRSAAAPTAGLHFTPGLFDRLTAAAIERVFLTLEVGAGTFRPVRTEDPARHVLPPERYKLPPATADAIHAARAEGRRIVATGTTVVRTLEHALGGEGGAQGETGLFIRPGYTFSVVDALLTNFHLPRSTLLMLVAAFAGHDLIRQAYAEAVRERYRFYSFGDAMLILP